MRSVTECAVYSYNYIFFLCRFGIAGVLEVGAWYTCGIWRIEELGTWGGKECSSYIGSMSVELAWG